MIRNHWGCWTVLAMLVGCNGKLVLPGGDSAGAGGDSAGVGGMSTAGGAGRAYVTGGSGGDYAGGGASGGGGELEIGGVAGESVVGGAPNGNSAGWFEGSGAGGTIEPGQLGQPCIPGGTVSEGSGFTATEIVTLDHCLSGLACASSGKCTNIPDCPRPSGVCVLRRPKLGAEASAGPTGSSGAPNSGGSGGSFAGAAPVPTPNEVGVLDLTADDSSLYWVEYGTRDSLGNYQNDGVAMSYSFADKKTHVLASALAGAQRIVPTTLHAYVAVDGGQLVGNPEQNQILRLPLAGGTPAAVGAFDYVFIAASSGDSLYLKAGDALKVITGDGAFAPFLSGVGDDLTADADSLYYSTSAGLVRAPVSGDPPTTVTPTSLPRALSGDWIYGLEGVDGGIMLEKIAKTGGTWTRTKALGPGTAQVLQMVGERYFIAATFWNSFASSSSLLTGTLAADAKPVRITNLPDPNFTPTKFVGTPSAVYWTDGRAIYQRPLSDAPAP